MKLLKLLKYCFRSKIITYVIIFVIGLALGYTLGYYRVLGSLFLFIKNIHITYPNINLSVINISPDFLGDIIALEAILVAVAVPISLTLASSVKEKDIPFFFTKEPLYKLQYFLLIPNIILSLFFKLIGVSNKCYLFILFIWAIANLVVFYFFIRLVHKYIVRPDKIILDKLSKYAIKIFK